jgi:Protein of unknown function (DUF664)
MTTPFPSPTTPASSRTEVFVRYLDYFRSRVSDKLDSLPPGDLRASRLPSGRPFDDPWADHRDGRWYVAPDEALDSLLAGFREQAARSNAIIEAHDLAEAVQPGERWDGAPPATLERVLFHLLQEYARHLGHLDIVAELAAGEAGE